MEEPNNYNNFDNDYKESIKYTVNDGSYFKDGFNWFCALYLRPIVDRTFFVFMSIMGVIITYHVIGLVFMFLPLKEDIYISIREKDLTKYATSIYDLSNNQETESTDEDVLKYLITNYVIERETHNYKSANINDMNTKLEKIKNNSSSDVFSEFRSFMSRENQSGPFYFFGKNIETTVEINSFKFIRIHRESLIKRIIDYFNVKLLPIRAEVYYTLKTHVGDKVTSEKRKAVVSFKFSGIEYDSKTEQYLPVKFAVTSYKNYKVD